MPLPRSSKISRTIVSTAVAVMSLIGSNAGAMAGEYKLQTGDTIEFGIVGYPELSRRSVVDLDGTVVMPVIGNIEARDLSLSELRTKAAAKLNSKSIPMPKADGSDNWIVFNPDQLLLDVAEYRPFFISGDVNTPGPQTFRPGMTVRQAVTSAGDYQMKRVRVDNPYMLLAQMKGEFDSFSAQVDASVLKIARIQAQLDDKSSFDVPGQKKAQLPPNSLAGQLSHLEQSQMTALDSDLKKEKAALELSIQKAGRRMDLLERQQDTDRQGMKEDVDELKRVKDLFDKGLIPITRVNDAQRSVLLSSTRDLQTSAQVAQLELEQVQLDRSREKLDEQRRIDLMKELQIEKVNLAQTRAKLESVISQMTYVDALRSDMAAGRTQKPKITITRRVDGKSTEVDGDEDTEVMPGDVISVDLGLNDLDKAGLELPSAVAKP
ncbi:type I secretion membrane fusion protein, HlyD family [Hartmannibacter diazotrophicus]|uniref:Type I secretion membrane fusion protein, HlyD family n=1 Tax=Hartmannibacter diazotrophicus TaxID=1482074 RepID=A0A2C9DE06_9HYPH|nr:polysaccharide biosynthesis/export family protein [Hartmannibacter diazotrophicus]SON58001.1 type I secretion membrane fusion protein, HlyD family [Hartmannibacter diazotrophicus]